MFTSKKIPKIMPPAIKPPLTPLEKLNKLRGNVKNAGKVFIVFVIVLVIIFVFALPVIYVLTNMRKIRKNWPKYRCSPAVMPFASMINKNVSTSENFQFCIGNIIDNSNKKSNSPTNNNIGKITTILTSFSGDMQNMRSAMYNIKQNAVDQFNDIQQKMYNAYKRIAYIFKLIMKVIVRFMITLRNLFLLGKYAFWTLASMWNGPIGGFIRFFCFGGETLMNLDNGKILPIRDLKIDDKLIDGSLVTGVLEFNKCETEMYLYNGIYVSGNHFVYEHNQLIKISNSKTARRVDYNLGKIYCLMTDTGIIQIGDYKFTDFNIVKNSNLYEMMAELLVGKPVNMNITNEFNSFYSGYTLNSKINGIKVNDIKVGDTIGENKILGKIYFTSAERTIYKIPDTDVWVLENGLLKNSDSWKLINDLKWESKIIKSNKQNIFVNFITKNGILKINEHQFIDFELANNNYTYNLQEKMIEKEIAHNNIR
jgi:hypothetical protein